MYLSCHQKYEYYLILASLCHINFWTYLVVTQKIFKKMDADGNGYFNTYEFRQVLNTLGTAILICYFFVHPKSQVFKCWRIGSNCVFYLVCLQDGPTSGPSDHQWVDTVARKHSKNHSNHHFMHSLACHIFSASEKLGSWLSVIFDRWMLDLVTKLSQNSECVNSATHTLEKGTLPLFQNSGSAPYPEPFFFIQFWYRTNLSTSQDREHWFLTYASKWISAPPP